MANITVIFNNETVTRRELDKPVCVIGRTEDCDLQIDNLGISRNHARILCTDGAYFVEDMNSSNGTFVNGQRVQRVQLNEGDEIVIGKYVINFSLASSARAASASANKQTVSASVPGSDSLHTMTMDGDAIRKRIEEMKRQKDTEMRRPVSAEPEPGPAPAEAKAEEQARAAELAQMRKTMNLLKAAVAAAVVAAIAAVVYFAFLRGGGPNLPQ